MDRKTSYPSCFDPRAAPALWPAIGLIAGAAAAPYLDPPAWAAALVAVLGVALGGRGGCSAAAFGLGLAAAAVQPPGPLAVPALRLTAPVELVARVGGHPERRDDELLVPLRARVWRQRDRGGVVAFDLLLTAPAATPAPALGSTVRVRGYLRRSAGYANSVRYGPGRWRLRLKSARFLSVEEPPRGWARWAASLRARGEASLARRGGADTAGAALARALVLGDRSRLSEALRDALRRAGLAHLLAVSGLHVGLLAALLLLAAAPLPRRMRSLPAVLGIGLYLLLIGPQPAVLRASLMGIWVLAALGSHRPPQPMNALAWAAALLVLQDPAITSRLGFRLTVAACAGILVLGPRYAARWRALPEPVRRPLAISIAAQLATLPWTLPLAGGVHPLAPVLNLLAIPWLALFLLAAFAWWASALVFDAGASLVPLLDALALPLEALSHAPASPALYLPLPFAPWTAPILVAVTVAASLDRRAARAVLVAAALCLTGAGAPPAAEQEEVEIVFFDVGQGDSILLRDGRHAALVDGGGWPNGGFGARVLVPALARLGVRRLDALVLTHPDRDHCAGLVEVGRYLPADEIWSGPGWRDEPCAAALLRLGAGRWRVLWRGERERVGRFEIETLHPPPGLRREVNDRSLVLRVAALGRRVLLTGDVGAAVERRLAAAGTRADVLKLAHHGSKSSTTAAFLSAVRPRLAVVSAGRANPYGHPHPTVLERVAAPVLRTDRAGMIRLRIARSGRIAITVAGPPGSELSTGR